MKILDPGGNALVAGGSLYLVQFMKMHFFAPLCLNSSNWNFEYAGDTYRGAYGLGQISPIEDSPGEIKGLTFEMSGQSADLIALALDDSKVWQGTRIDLLTVLLNSDYQIVDTTLAWSGRGDTMSIQEENDKTIIQATAESSAVDFMRNHVLSYNDADQQMLYPGDRFFEFVTVQVDAPVVWPAKEWFFK